MGNIGKVRRKRGGKRKKNELVYVQHKADST